MGPDQPMFGSAKFQVRRDGLVTGIILAICLPLVPVLSELWRVAFCFPAGVIAATFLGVGWQITSEGVRILADPSVHVTAICSGASFFVLLVALFVGLAVAHRPGKYVCAMILPTAYVLTLLANVSRIILSWYGRLVSQVWFTSRFDNALHMLIGMIVFLPLLILSYELAKRRVCHES